MNPLLDFSGLPRFSDFKPEHVSPAVDTLLAENRALIERLSAPDIAPTWIDFVERMEDANERLGRVAREVLSSNQWDRFVSQLTDIQNPVVRTSPSKYSIKVKPRHRASPAAGSADGRRARGCSSHTSHCPRACP